jgi:DNA (cytosine-5)-methyltransferase 1
VTAYEQVVGSLCTGYGGLDLGLELALGPVRHAWHVEYDKHPAAILASRFPGVPNYGDLTTLDHDALEPVDWLTAGYPCQPFSHAGKRKGASDERHLWPFVAGTVGALRPRGVLLENVAGHVSLGLDAVLWDLAALGYDATWGVVRAADAGAPHRRERIFILATDADGEQRPGLHERRGSGDVATGTGTGRPGGSASQGTASQHSGGASPVADADDLGHERVGSAWRRWTGLTDCGHAASDSDSGRCQECRECDSRPIGGQPASRRGDSDGLVAWGVYEPAIRRWEHITGRIAPRPTEPGRVGERLSPLFVEWLMGLPAGWVTDVPGLARNAQLKALGNGVVPQQAALAVRLLQPAHNAIGEVA